MAHTSIGGWPIMKNYRHIGCPIHAVSSHEWVFALRANRPPLSGYASVNYIYKPKK